MIFKRLNEGFTEQEKETLIEDITEEHNDNMNEVDQVRELLTSEGFEEQRKLNGVAFVKEIDNVIRAQMYIDTTKFNYSCYVNYENEDNEVTSDFQMGGQINSVLSAAERLLKELQEV